MLELFIINLKSKFMRKEETDMAVIYANLIEEGLKEYKEVPKKDKERVKKILIERNREDLVVE